VVLNELETLMAQAAPSFKNQPSRFTVVAATVALGSLLPKE